MPPSHGVNDNSIPLVSSSLPPNVRPYHHPFSQKNEIEKIVQELLTADVICPSTSPHSSPMVKVLKKEGTFHMCLEFHAPTNSPSKTNFLFLSLMMSWMNWEVSSYLINLIFILATTISIWKRKTFPRLQFDLMKATDFLVIPFGLSNAPSTFQSIMNHVFCPFLRHFVLGVGLYFRWGLFLVGKTQFWRRIDGRKKNTCKGNPHENEESMQGTHAGKLNHVRVRVLVRDCNG